MPSFLLQLLGRLLCCLSGDDVYFPVCCFVVFLTECLFLISVAASLAPPPPSILQVTPQLPLMGFVARVQENSKFAASLCDDLVLHVAFVSSG